MDLETCIKFIFYSAELFVWLVGIKAILIGSDFSFHHWFKYKKEYYRWYKGREIFEEYLILKQYREKNNKVI